MATKVTVDAHAGWPVKVEAIDKEYDHEKGDFTGNSVVVPLGVVAPNTYQDFFCTDSRQILITEMTKEEGGS